MDEFDKSSLKLFGGICLLYLGAFLIVIGALTYGAIQVIETIQISESSNSS